MIFGCSILLSILALIPHAFQAEPETIVGEKTVSDFGAEFLAGGDIAGIIQSGNDAVPAKLTAKLHHFFLLAGKELGKNGCPCHAANCLNAGVRSLVFGWRDRMHASI